MLERYIMTVVVPPVTSEQPLLSLIVAFTLTAVTVFGVRTMLEAPFKMTFVTVGAALPTVTVEEAVCVVPAPNAGKTTKAVCTKSKAAKKTMAEVRTYALCANTRPAIIFI